LIDERFSGLSSDGGFVATPLTSLLCDSGDTPTRYGRIGMTGRREMTTDSECMTLTVEEAARILGISRNSAFRAVQRGQLPSMRIGRRILVPRVLLTEMIAASKRA
jgi:excisionase family DNA binding protein